MQPKEKVIGPHWVFKSLNNRYDIYPQLHSLGVKKGDAVSIHSPNSSQWVVCDQAILSIGAVNVAIYTTQPTDQIVYILNDSKTVVHFVSTKEMFEGLEQLSEVPI